MSPAPREGTSLFSRVAWGIVVGFVILHVGTLTFFNHEKMVDEASHYAVVIAERALAVADAARAEPELLTRLSTPAFGLSIEAAKLHRPARVWPHTDEVARFLRDRLSSDGFQASDGADVWYSAGRGSMQLVLQLPLDDRWLVVHAVGPDAGGHTMMVMFWTTVLSGGVLLAVLIATRRFTRVLPTVAEAAERVGRDPALAALPEKGPREIRRLTRTFNAMQRRVTELLAERTTMLGALSHDVRTLVTRLQLRLDRVEDDDLRSKVESDVSAITTLLDDALAFSREETIVEEQRRVDVPSLLQSLLDDESDLGSTTSYSGPDSATVLAPPVGLRRAFANLIDNAIRYGGSVAVSVARNEPRGVLEVSVADPGPGIPEADQARALKPFERLDPSRSRETGGFGLGLSIARSIVERCGGALTFDRTDDAFVVRVLLPL